MALQKPYMWNQNYLQIGRSLPRDSAGKLRKQDVECNNRVFFYFILLLVFKKPSLHIECTYSQIQWQNPSWGVTSVALQEWLWPSEKYWQSWQGAAFFACLGAGVLQPKQHPIPAYLGKAVLSGRNMKQGPRLQTTKWDMKGLAELKKEEC